MILFLRYFLDFSAIHTPVGALFQPKKEHGALLENLHFSTRSDYPNVHVLKENENQKITTYR